MRFMGKALVTVDKVKKDQLIVEMFNPRTCTHTEFERMVKRFRWPADCGIYLSNSRVCIETHFSNLQKPHWYRMNHSATPTAYACRRGNTIQWYAVRDLRAGMEVTWDYGSPDASWALATEVETALILDDMCNVKLCKKTQKVLRSLR